MRVSWPTRKISNKPAVRATSMRTCVLVSRLLQVKVRFELLHFGHILAHYDIVTNMTGTTYHVCSGRALVSRVILHQILCLFLTDLATDMAYSPLLWDRGTTGVNRNADSCDLSEKIACKRYGQTVRSQSGGRGVSDFLKFTQKTVLSSSIQYRSSAG